MIGCDNDFCEYEWFYYSCVGITRKPRGKWYCSEECRSAGENQLLLIIFVMCLMSCIIIADLTFAIIHAGKYREGGPL